MKNTKFEEALNYIDDDLITDADKKVISGKNMFIKYGSLAACLVLVLSAIIIPITKNKTVNNTTDEKYLIKVVDKTEAKSEIAVELKQNWAEMSDAQRYSALVLNGEKYETKYIAVNPENIGEKIGTAEAQGYNEADNTEHSLVGEAYEVAGISSDIAVCFKFNETDEYAYAYSKPFYEFATLGDFITLANLKNTLSTGLVCDYTYRGEMYVYTNEKGENVSIPLTVVYEDIKTETVFDMLLSDMTLENQTDADISKITASAVIGISASIDVLGYNNLTISLTEDGYMFTNLLDTTQCYYIGKDKVQSFIDMLTGEHSGYIYVYETEINEE